MRYEGSVATPSGRDELIYFEGPDDLDLGTAENMVRDLFGETLMWFRPAPPPAAAIGAVDESYPFRYLVHKSTAGTHLLQILQSDIAAWRVENHCCGDPWNWKTSLPNGLYILSGVHRIKDNIGATDWNREWVEVTEIRQLTGSELLKFKRGELLC